MTHHNVGIWVDDQKAVMVRLEPDREPEVIEITYDEVQKSANSSYTSNGRRLFLPVSQYLRPTTCICSVRAADALTLDVF